MWCNLVTSKRFSSVGHFWRVFCTWLWQLHSSIKKCDCMLKLFSALLFPSGPGGIFLARWQITHVHCAIWAAFSNCCPCPLLLQQSILGWGGCLLCQHQKIPFRTGETLLQVIRLIFLEGLLLCLVICSIQVAHLSDTWATWSSQSFSCLSPSVFIRFSSNNMLKRARVRQTCFKKKWNWKDAHEKTCRDRWSIENKKG